MNNLEGVIALIPTPFTDDGKVDDTGLRNIIDYDMENGCSGVGVLAAIGEGYLMSDEDWRSVVKTAVSHMNGKAPIVVGCAAMGTSKAAQLCKEAEDLGADAILGFNPQGFRPYTDEELIEHYMTLTGAVDIPIIAYARSDDPISLNVIKKLVDDKRISYMKYGWLSCELLIDIHRNLEDRLHIFCGADGFTLRYILLGCKGILTATAAVLPKENVTLLSMVQEGNIEEARGYYIERIMPWNDIGFYANWQAVHKLAFQHMGLIESDRCVPPQAPAGAHQVEEVKWLLKHLGKK